jgi:hypothetical protein
VSSPLGFLAAFLLVCAAVAVATSAIRGPDLRRGSREAFQFFAMMVLGIGAVSVVGYLLAWIFIRRP